MNIIQTAIDQSIATLKATGCMYTVTLPNGGGAVSNVVPEKKKRIRVAGFRAYYRVYEPLLSVMAPGELKAIDVGDGVDAETFRSSMCSWAQRNWGAKTYTTEVKDRTVHIYRMPAIQAKLEVA